MVIIKTTIVLEYIQYTYPFTLIVKALCYGSILTLLILMILKHIFDMIVNTNRFQTKHNEFFFTFFLQMVNKLKLTASPYKTLRQKLNCRIFWLYLH